MFSRFSNGCAVARSSWNVLRQDKALVVFPIMSALACTVVTALFLLPLARSGYVPVRGHLLDQGHGRLLTLYLAFVANNFVMIFFNAGLTTCAFMQFAGERPTVGQGLSAAWARLPQIAAWALFAGTVGWALRVLEERVHLLGRIVVAIIGVGWNVATFFVVPVLLVEQLGPLDAFRRSAAVMRERWGEVMGGDVGLGAVSLVMQLPGIGLVAAAILGTAHPMTLRVTLGVAGVLAMIVAATVAATLRGIFVAGLYRYAVTGEQTAGFEKTMLRDAFAARPA
jgi:hypothetical protein